MLERRNVAIGEDGLTDPIYQSEADKIENLMKEARALGFIKSSSGQSKPWIKQQRRSE